MLREVYNGLRSIVAWCCRGMHHVQYTQLSGRHLRIVCGPSDVH